MKKLSETRKARAYDLVAVRFAENLDRIWHYKVPKGRAHLGQALVVQNHKGTSIVFVIGLNAVNETQLMREIAPHELKWIKHKVAPL